MTKQEEIKTSEEWQELCKFEVLDPDGWDRLNFNYSWGQEKITRKEFESRLMVSTCRFHPSDWGNMWKDSAVEPLIRASNLDFERNQLEITICQEFEEADSEALQEVE